MPAGRGRSVRVLTARVLLIVAVLALVWTAALVLFGGIDVYLFGSRLRTHEPLRPFALAALALFAFVPLYGTARTHHWWWVATRRLDDGPVAIGLSIFILVLGLTYSSTVGGGSDSYGYLSQSQLWLSGSLHVKQPWASQAPWPNQAWTFSPLGYRPVNAAAQTELVPTYSPGLPLLMAAATRIAGHAAAFWIVPIAGALLVFLTYGIGRRLGSPRGGLIGAWLVATSPVMLFMLMQPMTDVPVAAAWAAAIFFLLGPSSWQNAAAAGLAGAMAILIRPNLSPLAGVLALWFVIRRRGPHARIGAIARTLAVYISGVGVGVAITAAINTRLYGSPVASGYGDLPGLFAWRHLLPNFRSYASWLVGAQTPFVLAGVVALCVPTHRLWPRVSDRRIFIVIGLFVTVLWAEYCAYLEFDDWTYLRFLLPCWPLLMIATGMAGLRLAREGSSGRVLALAGLIICLGVYEYRVAGMRGAFTIWRNERASVLVAKRVREITEPNAVVLSMFHSGSVRYYGGRITMRFDLLDQQWLDRGIEWLSARGAHPYLLVNDWEIPQFVGRFSSQRSVALVRRPPLFTFERAGMFLFDLAPPDEGPSEGARLTDVNEDLRSTPPAPAPQLAWQ